MARGFKTGGRVRGTPNRRTAVLAERLDELGLDVVAGLVAIAKDERADLTVKARILCELAGYLFPKRKAVDLSTDPTLLPPAPTLVIGFLEDQPARETK